ncbi:MAG: LuxR C-terminal-related transcriptional regulator [Propionibacteriales bacterium]|nr:LuxR C-terminal-related transcriptional regulator [Propionibacteriales bacterium]
MDHATTGPLETALEVRASERCRLLAETIVRRTRAHAVGLMGISADDGTHLVLLNVDYAPETLGHHATRHYTLHTPGVQQILRRPGRIHSWDDIADFRETPLAQAVYEPAGFHNGMSIALATPGRPAIGMLHVSTRDDQMDPDTLNLVERSRHLLAEWVDAMTRFRLARLSERQAQILCRVRDGLSNAEIAAELVIAPRTVTTHVEHILRRLGVANRTQAAVLAERYGLVTPALIDA